ncbi:hypothetical protein MRB53_009883 [Persea americana]|uniref:Uncharacterized protein n=1 Tax=Persea americana TaxID=3435 RepID=A0ACC2LRG4_PERAE|nr:hypothetical protein MRB53_009883 [Persea americana]
MDSNFGVPRELLGLQNQCSLYQPQLPLCHQSLCGTTVREEFSDATAIVDLAGAHTIFRSFPHTYGQPLAHFLRATAQVPNAQIITEHPPIRVGVVFCRRQSKSTDALWEEKYYYFIQWMGWKASHVALECALQSHSNTVFLREEVTTSKLTLFYLTKQVCDAVQAKAEQDKYHGVIFLPEELIESIP